MMGDLDRLMGANLRRLREDQCLRLDVLAARADLPPERLRAAEAGELRLKGVELLNLMQRLRCTFDAFFAALPPPRVPS